jgi:sugar lactone lactonase YvrE
MRLLAAAALTLTFTLTLSATPRHVTLLKEAGDAARAGDNDAVLAKLEEVAVLRPDYPRVHLNLAMYRAQAGEADAAMAALHRLATMGVRVNTGNAAFDSLRALPAFQELEPRLASGPDPVGVRESTTIEIAGVTGIIESCLRDPKSGAWFFGDVRNRCIWKSGPDGGAFEKFTSDEDALAGVFRLELSADGKTLWASTAAVGVMIGDDAQDGARAALVAIDLESGRVRARFAAPDDGRKHLIGDFIIANDDSILATDSMSPVIWRLTPESAALEPWLEHDDFVNLQGLALSSDDSTVFVADYSNGIWRIDVATKAVSLLTAPANASFFGIDALHAAESGVLAVQNGVNPQRVLRIEPHSCWVAACGEQARSSRPSQATTLHDHASSAARIVACGLPVMSDLALGSVHGGRFHFVADSGWALFDPKPEKEPEPRRVTIISVSVE